MLRPDYGARLHSVGTGPSVSLLFYEVPINHVQLTDVPCLTTQIDRVEEGIEYVVSFDFTADAAAHLLARCSQAVVEQMKCLGKTANPYERIPIDPPIIVDIAATLGPLQRSPTELLAPLLVHSVT